jgi:hypothetical protein
VHSTRLESDRRTDIAATEPLCRRRSGRTPVFVDFFHPSETGNEMVATLVAADAVGGRLP